jgi:lipopolysaccharide export system permease protein
MFGTILNRMIFAELVRVFLLALVTLTGLFLLAGLVAEATQRGIAPSQVLMIIPLLIPNTLPYTIPATTLFATCVVYGRLAHDNEITAIKAAGVHLGRLVAPGVLLGVLTAAGTMALYYDFIPRTHHMLRTQVFSDVEELLYTVLKKNGCLQHPKVKFAMWVRQVQGRRLIDAIFKKVDDNFKGYTLVARAREASIHYDAARNLIGVDMASVITAGENDAFAGNLTDKRFEVPLPDELLGTGYVRRSTDLTWTELLQRRAEMVDEVRKVRADAACPPPPDLSPAQVKEMSQAFGNLVMMKEREARAVDAELQMRPALAVGCLCFALIGGPVGIWFSRADYLSAFVSCFLPTVAVYYPLLLCGTNLAKDGRIPAAVGLWAADVAIGIGAVLLYGHVLRR